MSTPLISDTLWGIIAPLLDTTYAANGFADLGVVVPCCGTRAPLNDLTCHWPQGFARFILTVAEPNFADLTAAQVRELEALLGCPLRKIWVHL
jgi:hypothetical protein